MAFSGNGKAAMIMGMIDNDDVDITEFIKDDLKIFFEYAKSLYRDGISEVASDGGVQAMEQLEYANGVTLFLLGQACHDDMKAMSVLVGLKKTMATARFDQEHGKISSLVSLLTLVLW